MPLTRRPRDALFPGRVDQLPPHGRAAEIRMRPGGRGRTAVVFAISGVERGGVPQSTAATVALARCPRAMRAIARVNLPFRDRPCESAAAGSGALVLGFHGASNASFSAIG